MSRITIPSFLSSGEIASVQTTFAQKRLEARADALADRLSTRAVPIAVRSAMEEAAKLLAADHLVSPKVEEAKPIVLTIKIPKNLASRYPPDDERHNEEPHITLLYLTGDGFTPGKVDEFLLGLRAALKRQAPFRVTLQTHKGLQDFGDSESGTKALWFSVKDDPNGQLTMLHNFLKRELSVLGFDCKQTFNYNPHSTWCYVPNDQSEKDRQRMSSLAVGRFTDVNTWFDVRHVSVSLPSGKEVTIPLSPNLRPDKRGPVSMPAHASFKSASVVTAITKMSGDQLAIIRMIRKAPNGTMTVREIEKSRVGSTPWFKLWMQTKQPKKDVVVSEDDISSSDVVVPDNKPRHLLEGLLSAAETAKLPWTDKDSILPNNKVFGLVVPEADVNRLFSAWGESAVGFIKQYNGKAEMSGHPVVPGKIILSWVRYSELDDNTLWVHEVQTDMFWAVGSRHIRQPDVQHAMSLGGPMSKETNYYIRDVIKERANEDDKQLSMLEFEVLREFVSEHSSSRIVFPTVQYRLDEYPADIFGDKAAPASVYNDIPRKLRFEKTNVESLNLSEAPPDGEVWVSASVKAVGARIA